MLIQWGSGVRGQPPDGGCEYNDSQVTGSARPTFRARPRRQGTSPAADGRPDGYLGDRFADHDATAIQIYGWAGTAPRHRTMGADGTVATLARYRDALYGLHQAAAWITPQKEKFQCI
jgi:hypothetical protein